jgi:glycosyltransferase involved in cell wall biosynthesis
MKIIYLHQYFNTNDMPGSTRSYELAKRLVKNGHSVFMITSKRDKHQIQRNGWTKEDGIDVFWTPVSYSNKMSYLRRLFSFFSYSIKSLKVALSIDADLIYATSTPLTIAIPAIIYSKIKAKPMVFEVRDLWPEIPIAIGALKSPLTKFLALWLEKLSYKNSKTIIALSNGMKDGIIKKGYPAEKINIITNLSNTRVYEKMDKTKDLGIRINNYFPEPLDKLVIYTGAFGHVNDVKYLIKIAGVLKNINSRIKFIIAGEGVEQQNIYSRAKQLGVLDNSVFIIDPLEKSKIPLLYSKASVVSSLFINLKELWNNSANKFFDGLAAGKPIMINYSGWQRLLLEKHNAGFYVPFDDHIKGAEILNKIVNNNELNKNMGNSAKKIANQHFAIDVQYPKFEKVLKSVIE